MREAIPAHGDWVEWSDPVTGDRLTGVVIEVDPETWTLGLRDVTRGNLHRIPARLVTRVAAPASDA